MLKAHFLLIVCRNQRLCIYKDCVQHYVLKKIKNQEVKELSQSPHLESGKATTLLQTWPIPNTNSSWWESRSSSPTQLHFLRCPQCSLLQHGQFLPTPRVPGPASQFCCLHTPSLMNEVAPCQARASLSTKWTSTPAEPLLPAHLEALLTPVAGGPALTLLSVSFPTSPWHGWVPASLERTTLSVTFSYNTPEDQ